MDPSRFFVFIRQAAGAHFRPFIACSATAGILQGLAIVSVALGIKELVQEGDVSFRLLVLFLLCLAGYYRAYASALARSTDIASNAVAEQELRLCDKLRCCRFDAYQRIDRSHIYTAIVESKDLIVEAGRSLGASIVGLTMALCALCYAASISFQGVVVALGMVGLSGLCFHWFMDKTAGFTEQARGLERNLVASLADLLDGFTELKLNQGKSAALFSSRLHPLSRQTVEAKAAAEAYHVRGTAFFTVFFFLPIAAVLFLLPTVSSLPPADMARLLTVILFSLSPLTSVIFYLPLAEKASQLVHSLQDFEQQLDAIRDPESSAPTTAAPHFEHLALNAIQFQHPAPAGQDPFTVSVESFTLRRGEIVFIAGGNGSGKSTFLRLLAGLYSPESGEVLVNGEPRHTVGMTAYRSFFSPVFTDFHLFKRLYGLAHITDEAIEAMLTRLELKGKVQADSDRRFSTTTALSTGQKKRLALACALLDDRQIFLLDEVAADFDAPFRTRFYRELLPSLRAEGRTVVAVSHDDRFFDIADRLLLMRDGRFVPLNPTDGGAE